MLLLDLNSVRSLGTAIALRAFEMLNILEMVQQYTVTPWTQDRQSVPYLPAQLWPYL